MLFDVDFVKSYLLYTYNKMYSRFVPVFNTINNEKGTELVQFSLPGNTPFVGLCSREVNIVNGTGTVINIIPANTLFIHYQATNCFINVEKNTSLCLQGAFAYVQ